MGLELILTAIGLAGAAWACSTDKREPDKVPPPKPSGAAKKTSNGAVACVLVVCVAAGFCAIVASVMAINSGSSGGSRRSGYEGLPAYQPQYGGNPVRSHDRQTGTHVDSHYRTPANDTKADNWSTRGNVNPYTGKPGSR